MVYDTRKKSSDGDATTAARGARVQTRSRRGVPLYLRAPKSDVLDSVKVRPADRKDEEQTWWLHTKIDRRIPISAYAIPREHLTLDRARTQPLVAPAPGATAPVVAVGTTVYTPDHLPAAVLGSDNVNIIVEGTKAIHYAVGAGSCVLVQAHGSWYLFDAGINQTEAHTLAEAIGKKIKLEVGGKSIRAGFLTHGHYDHFALFKWIAGEVQIEAIVANPRQLTREEYTSSREGILEADTERRAKEAKAIENDPVAREEFVKKLREGSKDTSLSDTAIERAWREEAAARIEARQPAIREVSAIPLENGQFDTLDTKTLAGEQAPHMNVEDLLPSRNGTELRGVVDARMRGKESTPMIEGEVDRMSTTYILRINGRDLVMMPDLRRPDLVKIRSELEAILGRDHHVEFREWVLGHHMQIGFEDGPVSARTMLEALEILHDFRAKGRSSGGGRNAVIASVNPDLVHPAHIRLLRLLGFETYLAHSQADVRTYEVLAGAKQLRGVRGPLSHESKGAPTLERSIVKGRELLLEKQSLVDRKRDQRGKDSRARKRALQTEIDALQGRIDRLSAAEEKLVDAVRAEPHDDAATRAAEHELMEVLKAEKAGAIVTSSSQLTDTAMVLLREPLETKNLAPDSPEGKTHARNMALRDQKSLVAALREKAQGAIPEARQEAYADLYAELVEYQRQLDLAAQAHEPGVTQEIIQAELEGVKQTRANLEGSFKGRSEAARLPDGALVETKVVRLDEPNKSALPGGREPSPTAKAMLKGLDRVGRVMGGVMVISTFTGSIDLIDRYENGQANLAQLGLGATREITSGVVGLRMLRGARVSNGVFVVISVLEIGEAMAGDYDYGQQRDRAVNRSVRNAAINIGCMYVGEALIATANPIGIAAGAVIMFIGRLVLGALFEDDPPESLYPGEITTVDEKLVELVAQYKIIAGTLKLEKRTPAEREALGFAPDSKIDTGADLQRPRMRALYLESQIVPAFEAAYEKARLGRAGLRELDEMRRQFLEMRAEASTDATDEETRQLINTLHGNMPDLTSYPEDFNIPEERDAADKVIPLRELTLRRLKAAEDRLLTITADEAGKMEQWSSIEKFSVDLIITTYKADPDWADIAERQRDLEARLISARYRIDPANQAVDPANPVRQDPLLVPGSPARTVYEKKLAAAEDRVRLTQMMILRWHWLQLLNANVKTPHIEALFNDSHKRYADPQDFQLAFTDDALDVYQTVMEEIDGPPKSVGGAEALFREPTARARYREELKSNRDYRKLLVRLQLNETAAFSLVRSLDAKASATHGGDDPGRAALRTKVAALKDRLLTLKNTRKERRGILFEPEVAEIEAKEHQRAVAYYTPVLEGGVRDKRLGTDEIKAIENTNLSFAGEGALARDVASRLEQVTELRIPLGQTSIPDATGAPMHISRQVPGIYVLDGLTSEKRQLVGVVKRQVMVTVVPLNDAATTALGGRAPSEVAVSRLLPATEDDLAP